jgi:WD40 repeat protein
MMHTALFLGILLIIGHTAAALPQNQPATVSFYKQIKPILQKRCQGCHQPASQGGKLVLTSYQAFRAGGATGPGFKPGVPEESVVMRFISGDPPLMPKNAKPLDKSEIELFRRWIAEGARDDTPAIQDPIDSEHPPVYRKPPVLSALAYSPDGKTLAVAGFREIILHKADGSGIIARLVGRSHRIESLAYSPDGKILAAVGGTPAQFGEVQFWDTATNTLKNAVELSYDTLYGASFSPDGTALACGGADNGVRIVSVPDGRVLLKFDNHSDWVFATTWYMQQTTGGQTEPATGDRRVTNRAPVHQEELYLLSTGRDRAIKLIVAKNGSFVDDINTHTSTYRAMLRHPFEEKVLVGGEDGIPRLYQIFRTKPRTMNQEDHNLLKAYEPQPGEINALAFSPDGKRFAVGGLGGEVRIYDTATGTRLSTLKGVGEVVFTLAFRPDGKEIAVGGFDGQVRLFDSVTGTLRKAFVPVPINKAIAGKPQ